MPRDELDEYIEMLEDKHAMKRVQRADITSATT